MKFGKLDNLQGVDLSLPPDHPRTRLVLESSGREAAGPTRFYLGAAKWGTKEWLGTWYPKGARAGDFLYHYSRQFNSIELNTTHYRIPGPDLVERWYEAAAPGFMFCPKVPQQISHYARLRAELPITAFIAAISGLKEKLGPTFVQLPEVHGPDAREPILDFMRDWPPEMPLQWEFRHPDWFQGPDPGAEEVCEALEATGQGLVITDVAGRRDVLHMRLTSPVLFLRFVANALHPSDYTRTDEWVARLKEWSALGLREAYILLHQPDEVLVPELAVYWAETLHKVLGVEVSAPKVVTEGGQQSLF